MKMRLSWLSLVLLAALMPLRLHAVATHVVIHRTPGAFARGELDHISVTEEGQLSISPAYRRLGDLPDPIIWSLVGDAQGNVYAATGNDGRIYRIKSGVKPEVVADFAELQVMSLAVSPKGELFAATLPQGKVYRIPAGGGPAEVFADLEPRYLWDMTFDGNDLLVATGAPGGITRITPTKEVKPLLKTEETHILTMALDANGVLYAGSADNGYVFRLNLRKSDDPPQVVLDAPGDEVKRLVLAPDGAVIVLSLGSADNDDKEESSLSGLLARAADQDKESRRETRIHRIVPGQPPEELWRAGDLTAHSLGFFHGQVLAGVGEEGKIVAIGLDRRVTFLADASGEQVTALRTGPGSSMLVAVSNPAAVYQIDDLLSDSGVFTSEVIDSRLFATWGRVDIRQELPPAGTVTVQTRSGNTDKPNATWSAWADVGERIASPASRYIQYRLTLKQRDKASPRVREVDLFYLPMNSGPDLGDITVMDPGIRLERKEDFRSDPEPKGVNRPVPPKPRPQTREKEDPLLQSARWEATDPDSDDLTYTVMLREASASTWRTLATEQKEEFVNFNAVSIPDGWYQLRVVARDILSNRPEDVKESDRLSIPFPIDHTAPVLTRTSVKVNGRRATVSFEGQDQTTLLDRGRYAIDGGPFIPVFPDDQVYDALRERVSFTTAELAPGDHVVVISIEDGVGNVVSGKLPVTIK